MGNMSYCRFQNTLSDLQDCEGHFGDELGKDEADARTEMYNLIKSIREDWGEDPEFSREGAN